jgi:hypothetical protein
MDQQKLRDQLIQLHDELEHAQSVDDDTRAVLDDLSKDIRELLDKPGDKTDRRYGLLSGSLQTNLTRFEATHPQLTAAMERAIDTLVQMGV